MRAAIDTLPMAPAATDWLRHSLTVSGPREAMAAFREDAAGAGVIPWQLDLDQMEQDWFLPLAAPEDGAPAISLFGARILARRLRDAAAANHQQAVSRLHGDRRCPFDLHRLFPVPAGILRLGPEDPASLAWLWSHWGTTRLLRHVRLLPLQADGRSPRSDRMAVEFWSADWSPWAAIARLRRARPALILDLRPHYADD